MPKSSKESTFIKFSKSPFRLGLSSDFNTIAQTLQDAQHEHQYCFQAQNQHNQEKEKKSVFSISGLASYITKISMYVCVFWPPGELEKADCKDAINLMTAFPGLLLTNK